MRRRPHPTDRRITMVELTGGAEGVEAQFSAFQTEVAELFAALDDADADALSRAFRVLRERIEAPRGSTRE